MGHRHLFGPSYMLETENDQTWNLTENPYMHTARTGVSESTSSSIIHPSDNMSIDGAQYAHCTHTPISNNYSSLPHNLQIPNYQQQDNNNPTPSDLSMHTSSAAAFYITPQDYTNQASSSNYNGNPFNEEDLFDIRRGNHYKRKSPGLPDGSGSGSSSDVTMLTEPWQETPNINFLHTPWDYNYNTTNPSLSIGESSVRNVRSRAAFDLETNSSRTHLANNLARDYFTTSRPMEVTPSLDLVTHDWNPTQNNSLNCEMNPFLEGTSNPSSSLEIGQQNNNPITRNNLAIQNSVRGVRSSYSQRPASSFRVSSSNLRLGHNHTDEGLQLATNNYSSRNPRPPSTTTTTTTTIGWHTSDRTGRARLSGERFRSFSGMNFHDRAPPEGLVIVDRSGFYGSRNPFDQHRDMRLDIDDMSYEDLLALGERIGSVATGLPENLISKCVQESIYCSSDQIQDELTCVICLGPKTLQITEIRTEIAKDNYLEPNLEKLAIRTENEEYANMDDIGMLKACKHDFHVGCIKKWLSMKNVCPICKTEPMKQR